MVIVGRGGESAQFGGVWVWRVWVWRGLGLGLAGLGWLGVNV